MPIVQAIGIATAHGGDKTDLQLRMEAAMRQAVLDAQDEDETDPEIIRARILAARDKTLREGG